jgi:LCP family protein required for cell wall assembly
MPRRRSPRPIALLLVAVVLGYPLLLGFLAWTSLNRVPALAGSRPEDTPGRIYLVVGSDSRAGLTAEERRTLGTGRAAGRRTDTIMIMAVPPGGGPTVLVSVPRDSYVPIPGHGSNKINAAYAFGGPRLLVDTVEQAMGIRVDTYVETGLGGFAAIVDAVGGVNICVERPMRDVKAHINLKAGCQDFDGPTALGYARARYSDPRGDLGRVERQRKVLAAIANRALSPSVLVQPWRAIPAARAGGNALTVDEGASPVAVTRFVLGMRAVAGGGGLSLTVPISNPAYSTPAGQAVLWDQARSARLFRALRNGRTENIRPLAEEQERLLRGRR